MANQALVAELAAQLERSFSGKVSLGASTGAVGADSGERSRALRTGLRELDESFGGLPRGRISELVGAGSSGKLGLLLSLLKEVLASGASSSAAVPASLEGSGLAALIDLSGTVFPGEPWAVGRLLVVRPRSLAEALRSLDILVSSGTLELVALEATGMALQGGGLPEAMVVRLSRLARETGTALVSCSCDSVFGSAASLRLQFESGPSGEWVVRVAKNRQGALGAAVLSRPFFPFLASGEQGKVRAGAGLSARLGARA